MASSEVEDLIFGEICRCCMASKPRMKPLFDTNLHEMLSAVTGLQLSKNDGLPSQLCVPCVLQVRRSHFFKVQCEQTDIALRSYVIESKFSEGEEQQFNPQPEEKVSVKEERLDVPGTAACDESGAEANGAKVKPEKIHHCTQCSKSFEMERKLKRHMRIHTSERPHACPECDMTFVEKSNLSKHMRKHTGELRNSTGKPHLCSECGKAFKYGTSLSRHRRLHANRNLFTCQICSKGYVEQQTLDMHMRTHTNERPFACPSCDKCFAQRVNLERHERTHSGIKPYGCDVCGNSFTQKSYLIIHKRIHTQEKPYECVNCAARFISRNAMMKHQRTPCSNRPYWCTYCKKSFRYKKCLRTHRRNHLLESPHACQYCESRYMSATKLVAHIKAKHPNVPCRAEDYGVDESNRMRRKNIQRRNPKARPQPEESEYEEMSVGEEEEEGEEIEIASVGMLDEEEEEESAGQLSRDEEVVHVMFNGDGEPEVLENPDEQDDQYAADSDIRHGSLLDIQIMNPGEEDSDIEQ
ncbi:KRAB box and zinc finger, C2H2 type domain containing protein-like protein [Anopheles sinensis]|uniref:KRAB box and zinc finger, C2H2 type domain containing protein-like protein n=1 Tax=Anopheles sinensis TaxID=74873 RepID=A0A084VII6_ANOSI|nr:KRAB box and zinc finger, C2H2 type domain containing protein-like protein [Anopheles sinensis]